MLVILGIKSYRCQCASESPFVYPVCPTHIQVDVFWIPNDSEDEGEDPEALMMNDLVSVLEQIDM